mgnify:CR=1 FL=1
MTGYKQIIKNMVEAEVTRFTEKKSGKFIEVISVELSTDNKDFGNPIFDVEIVVDFAGILKRDYLVHGYVSDYGSVVICSVMFTRHIRKDGETEFKPVTEFVTGKELESFVFDH